MCQIKTEHNVGLVRLDAMHKRNPMYALMFGKDGNLLNINNAAMAKFGVKHVGEPKRCPAVSDAPCHVSCVESHLRDLNELPQHSATAELGGGAVAGLLMPAQFALACMQSALSYMQLQLPCNLDSPQTWTHDSSDDKLEYPHPTRQELAAPAVAAALAHQPLATAQTAHVVCFTADRCTSLTLFSALAASSVQHGCCHVCAWPCSLPSTLMLRY